MAEIEISKEEVNTQPNNDKNKRVKQMLQKIKKHQDASKVQEQVIESPFETEEQVIEQIKKRQQQQNQQQQNQQQNQQQHSANTTIINQIQRSSDYVPSIVPQLTHTSQAKPYISINNSTIVIDLNQKQNTVIVPRSVSSQNAQNAKQSQKNKQELKSTPKTTVNQSQNVKQDQKNKQIKLNSIQTIKQVQEEDSDSGSKTKNIKIKLLSLQYFNFQIFSLHNTIPEEFFNKLSKCYSLLFGQISKTAPIAPQNSKSIKPMVTNLKIGHFQVSNTKLYELIGKQLSKFIKRNPFTFQYKALMQLYLRLFILPQIKEIRPQNKDEQRLKQEEWQNKLVILLNNMCQDMEHVQLQYLCYYKNIMKQISNSLTMILDSNNKAQFTSFIESLLNSLTLSLSVIKSTGKINSIATVQLQTLHHSIPICHKILNIKTTTKIIKQQIQFKHIYTSCKQIHHYFQPIIVNLLVNSYPLSIKDWKHKQIKELIDQPEELFMKLKFVGRLVRKYQISDQCYGQIEPLNGQHWHALIRMVLKQTINQSFQIQTNINKIQFLTKSIVLLLDSTSYFRTNMDQVKQFTQIFANKVASRMINLQDKSFHIHILSQLIRAWCFPTSKEQHMPQIAHNSRQLLSDLLDHSHVQQVMNTFVCFLLLSRKNKILMNCSHLCSMTTLLLTMQLNECSITQIVSQQVIQLYFKDMNQFYSCLLILHLECNPLQNSSYCLIFDCLIVLLNKYQQFSKIVQQLNYLLNSNKFKSVLAHHINNQMQNIKSISRYFGSLIKNNMHTNNNMFNTTMKLITQKTTISIKTISMFSFQILSLIECECKQGNKLFLNKIMNNAMYEHIILRSMDIVMTAWTLTEKNDWLGLDCYQHNQQQILLYLKVLLKMAQIILYLSIRQDNSQTEYKQTIFCQSFIKNLIKYFNFAVSALLGLETVNNNQCPHLFDSIRQNCIQLLLTLLQLNHRLIDTIELINKLYSCKQIQNLKRLLFFTLKIHPTLKGRHLMLMIQLLTIKQQRKLIHTFFDCGSETQIQQILQFMPIFYFKILKTQYPNSAFKHIHPLRNMFANLKLLIFDDYKLTINATLFKLCLIKIHNFLLELSAEDIHCFNLLAVDLACFYLTVYNGGKNILTNTLQISPYYCLSFELFHKAVIHQQLGQSQTNEDIAQFIKNFITELRQYQQTYVLLDNKWFKDIFIYLVTLITRYITNEQSKQILVGSLISMMLYALKKGVKIECCSFDLVVNAWVGYQIKLQEMYDNINNNQLPISINRVVMKLILSLKQLIQNKSDNLISILIYLWNYSNSEDLNLTIINLQNRFRDALFLLIQNHNSFYIIWFIQIITKIITQPHPTQQLKQQQITFITLFYSRRIYQQRVQFLFRKVARTHGDFHQFQPIGQLQQEYRAITTAEMSELLAHLKLYFLVLTMKFNLQFDGIADFKEMRDLILSKGKLILSVFEPRLQTKPNTLLQQQIYRYKINLAPIATNYLQLYQEVQRCQLVGIYVLILGGHQMLPSLGKDIQICINIIKKIENKIRVYSKFKGKPQKMTEIIQGLSNEQVKEKLRQKIKKGIEQLQAKSDKREKKDEDDKGKEKQKDKEKEKEKQKENQKDKEKENTQQKQNGSQSKMRPISSNQIDSRKLIDRFNKIKEIYESQIFSRQVNFTNLPSHFCHMQCTFESIQKNLNKKYLLLLKIIQNISKHYKHQNNHNHPYYNKFIQQQQAKRRTKQQSKSKE